MDEQGLQDARARIENAHGLVVAGRYDEAIAGFTEALPVLTAALGGDHADVVELKEDIVAARSMRDVWTFGQQVGFRWNDPTSTALNELPKPPKPV